jgi:hypothetical protein
MKNSTLNLLKAVYFAIIFLFIHSCSSCSTSSDECKGFQCDFFNELDQQFKPTGLEKDQGYRFLKAHSELDSTTERIIVRSISGIYFVYKSNEGWYAQKKNEDEKFTLNELGHFLAEKELNYEEIIKNKLDEVLINAKNRIKNEVQDYNRDYFIEVDTAVFNGLSIDSTFLDLEFTQLRRGEITFNDFISVFDREKNEWSLFYGFFAKSRSKIGFQRGNEFYPIFLKGNSIFDIEVKKEQAESIEWHQQDSYLLQNKIVVTNLKNKYSSTNEITFLQPFIYIPQEKKWYGIDQWATVNKKYHIY